MLATLFAFAFVPTLKPIVSGDLSLFEQTLIARVNTMRSMIRFLTRSNRLELPDLEPFNGCNEMRLFRGSDEDTKGEGAHRVVVTARLAHGSVWMKTIVIRSIPGAQTAVMD